LSVAIVVLSVAQLVGIRMNQLVPVIAVSALVGAIGLAVLRRITVAIGID
jgi:hypothetical protein